MRCGIEIIIPTLHELVELQEHPKWRWACVGALSSCAGPGVQPCLPSWFFRVSFLLSGVLCPTLYLPPPHFNASVCLFDFEKLGLSLEPWLALNWRPYCRRLSGDRRDEPPCRAFFAFESHCVSHSSSSHLILALFYLVFLIPNHSFFSGWSFPDPYLSVYVDTDLGCQWVSHCS